MMNKKLNMHGFKKSKKHATHKTHTDSYSAVREMAAGELAGAVGERSNGCGRGDDERPGFVCAMILLMKPDNLVEICQRG